MTETKEQIHEHTDAMDMDNSKAEIIDPNCVAEKPYKVSFQDITSAWFLIKSGIEYTPCTVIIILLQYNIR